MNCAMFFKHFDLLAAPGVRPSPVAATSARTGASEFSIAARLIHVAAPEDGAHSDDAMNCACSRLVSTL